MAKIDELVGQVNDPKLRAQLAASVKDMRSRKRFGLVYEEHIPETVVCADAVGVRVGAEVILRKEPANRVRYSVERIAAGKATVVAGGDTRKVPVRDLLVVKRFGEAVYPVLRASSDPVVRADGRAFHTVLNGENFHALQLLLFAYIGQVDVIYIDPPYNTGARDWTYSNDYVDDNDSFQHSKWLSMMEKRLRLAKKLLKPDGVLIVTIDEHEVSNLGVLLGDRELFADARRQMVTIVNNAAGVTQGGFYRVEEYAFFCFRGGAKPVPTFDDYLSDEKKAKKTPVWFSFIRYGGINSLPAKRPNLVYPIAIDPETNRIVGTGRSLKDMVDAGEVSGDLNAWRPDPGMTIDGFPVVWPYRGDGSVSTWQGNTKAVTKLVKEGFLRVRPQKDGVGGNQFSVSYVKAGNQKKILAGEIAHEGRENGDGPYLVKAADKFGVAKTVWKRSRHDAGKWGSRALRELLGSVTFDYAKSPYAVLDTLRTVIGDNPNALVLDFFAGSGTTLQSVAMLNAEDDGARRCILVTNNQVDEAASKLLHDQGKYLGDPEFDAKGICTAVTIPRIRNCFTGQRDGQALEGEYQDGRKLSDGFDENAAFFDLDYEDPDQIEIGERFGEVLPALWLAAGANGDPAAMKAADHWFLTEGYPFAVLLDEDHFGDFASQVAERPDLTHIWLVTDSEPAFARMRSRLDVDVPVGMLYRDYLRNFRINVEA